MHCESIIYSILFSHRYTQSSFVIYSCYLPPEGSPYANTSVFFGHIISNIYINNSVDSVILCGDFNARIGSCQDVIKYIDNIHHLNNIDSVKMLIVTV